MKNHKEKSISGYPDVISYECIQKIKEQMEKNICKIKYEKTTGTGFFCKIPIPNKNQMLPVFITNNHIINEKLIYEKPLTIKIDIKIENEVKEIIINEKRKCYTSKEYDLTIIEIKKKDQIKNFLELDDIIINDILNNKNKNKEFNDETIYIIQYPGGKLSASFGRITGIDENQKFNFIYKCSTMEGSSGSPILKLNNKVIGIHKGTSKSNSNNNEGTLLNYPIKEFIKNNYKANNENSLKNNENRLKNNENSLKNNDNNKKRNAKKQKDSNISGQINFNSPDMINIKRSQTPMDNNKIYSNIYKNSSKKDFQVNTIKRINKNTISQKNFFVLNITKNIPENSDKKNNQKIRFQPKNNPNIPYNKQNENIYILKTENKPTKNFKPKDNQIGQNKDIYLTLNNLSNDNEENENDNKKNMINKKSNVGEPKKNNVARMKKRNNSQKEIKDKLLNSYFLKNRISEKIKNNGNKNKKIIKKFDTHEKK